MPRMVPRSVPCATASVRCQAKQSPSIKTNLKKWCCFIGSPKNYKCLNFCSGVSVVRTFITNQKGTQANDPPTRRVIETNRNRSKSWPEQRGEAQEYVQRQPKSVTLFFALRNSNKKTK